MFNKAILMGRLTADPESNKRTAVEIQTDNVFFVGGKGKGAAPVDIEAVECEEVEA